MNIKDFSALLKAKAAELNDFRHRKLPVLVGRKQKTIFRKTSAKVVLSTVPFIPGRKPKEGKKAGKELPPNMVRYFPAEITCSAPSNIFRETPASP